MPITNSNGDQGLTRAGKAREKQYSLPASNSLSGMRAQYGYSLGFSKAGECDFSVKYPDFFLSWLKIVLALCKLNTTYP